MKKIQGKLNNSWFGRYTEYYSEETVGEVKAINYQRSQPIYNKTSADYKVGAQKYYEENGGK